MVTIPPPRYVTEATDENFRWMEAGDERVIFDTQVREYLSISGDEFLRRLHAGEYADALHNHNDRGIHYLAMLSRIVR